jgi:hypothetical protein
MLSLSLGRGRAEAVTIDKGADSKEKELYGWKASSRNRKYLEQH